MSHVDRITYLGCELQQALMKYRLDWEDRLPPSPGATPPKPATGTSEVLRQSACHRQSSTAVTGGNRQISTDFHPRQQSHDGLRRLLFTNANRMRVWPASPGFKTKDQ
jgi:hypothetical protein